MVKEFFSKYEDLIWAAFLLILAFTTSPTLSPLVGAIAFTALFTLAVALIKKHMDKKKNL